MKQKAPKPQVITRNLPGWEWKFCINPTSCLVPVCLPCRGLGRQDLNQRHTKAHFPLRITELVTKWEFWGGAKAVVCIRNKPSRMGLCTPKGDPGFITVKTQLNLAPNINSNIPK